jgi:hypothetical protein
MCPALRSDTAARSMQCGPIRFQKPAGYIVLTPGSLVQDSFAVTGEAMPPNSHSPQVQGQRGTIDQVREAGMIAQPNGAPKRSPTYLKLSSKPLIESNDPPTVTASLNMPMGVTRQPQPSDGRLIREWTMASKQDQAAFMDWVSGRLGHTPAPN